MKDYCTCGIRRIEQTFLGEGIVYCSDCRQPLCCDLVLNDPRVETHPAENRNEGRFTCWQHQYDVAGEALSHTFSKM